MDAERFDQMTKLLSAGGSRRGALRLLAGAGLAAMAPRRVAAQAACDLDSDCPQLSSCSPAFCVEGQCVNRGRDCDHPCRECDLSPDPPYWVCAPTREGYYTGDLCTMEMVPACRDQGECDFPECHAFICKQGECSFNMLGGYGPCSSDGNPCTADACGGDGDCYHTPVADGTECPGGACSKGTCCPTGHTTCGGACVDTQTEAEHCGVCGEACAAGETCQKGVCATAPAPACKTGLTRCNGRCVNLNTNEANCGRCGRRCQKGSRCRKGRCRHR